MTDLNEKVTALTLSKMVGCSKKWIHQLAIDGEIPIAEEKDGIRYFELSKAVQAYVQYKEAKADEQTRSGLKEYRRFREFVKRESPWTYTMWNKYGKFGLRIP